MTQHARRLRRRLAPLALLGVAALALSGCMRMQLDMTVNENDTVSGTAVLAVSDSVIELMGSQADSLWEDSGFDNDEGVTVEDYAADDYTGKKYTFADTPLADFSEEDMTITREGDEFVVTGSLDMTDMSTEDLEGMGSGLADSLDVVISFTFPGEVTSANGAIEGNTVTWEPQIGEANPLEARASATGGGSGQSIALILGVVAGVVVVAGIVIGLMLAANRKKAAAAAQPAPFADPLVPAGYPVDATPAPAAAPAAPIVDAAPVTQSEPAAPAAPPATEDGTTPTA